MQRRRAAETTTLATTEPRRSQSRKRGRVGQRRDAAVTTAEAPIATVATATAAAAPGGRGTGAGGGGGRTLSTGHAAKRMRLAFKQAVEEAHEMVAERVEHFMELQKPASVEWTKESEGAAGRAKTLAAESDDWSRRVQDKLDSLQKLQAAAKLNVKKIDQGCLAVVKEQKALLLESLSSASGGGGSGTAPSGTAGRNSSSINSRTSSIGGGASRPKKVKKPKTANQSRARQLAPR